MIDSERFKLLYGPYRPPQYRVGDKLPCEYVGREVKVTGISEGRIQWPRARRPRSLILCGELIRAVRVESVIAVSHHWGVSTKTVWKWRRALGVPSMTLGSRRLRIDYAVETLTPEVRAAAREAMGSAEVRAKLSAMRAGRPQHPNLRAAAREVARRPKSEAWKRGQSERSRKMWENPEKYGLPPRHEWTEQENALLGTDSDSAIAKILGLSRHVVFDQRRRLGIPRIPNRWTDAEIELLGTASDPEVALKLGRTVHSVRIKRTQIGVPSALPRWKEEEIGLLGTASDPEIARRLGRTASCVQSKREQLGIPPFFRRWTKAEVALLGSDTDNTIAELLGRSPDAVKVHRVRLGIPAYR
ncbi:MAG: hypothetical protein ACLQGP_13270 [Isosphaeraceae bacterium]